MSAAVIYLNTLARKALRVVGVPLVMVLMFSLSVNIIPSSAGAMAAEPLCGNGSLPDYGFTYDLQQTHWTVNWQGYVSEDTVTDVDTILDKLNADSVAQTMILIQALGDTVDEAMNTIQLGGTDWNDAVKAYNTRRAQIKGEIVARVSAYFGFDLPVTFPYYQGGNAGQPIQNPLATPQP
jgi:hypothetical protein